MSYLLPVNESITVGIKDLPTDEELAPLFKKIGDRIREIGTGYGGQSFVLGFARRMDATSDPDCYIHMAEMEAAYKIEPYFRPKQSRYTGL